MSIKDDLLTQEREKRNRPCGVMRFLDTLDRETKVEYIDALNEKAISATALTAHMREMSDEAPSYGMIKTHRRGECSCVHSRGIA